jgi:hypothetical protein
VHVDSLSTQSWNLRVNEKQENRKSHQNQRKTMPSDVSLTIAEREAELAALQSAFDEYITSSRELEEELDAELGKMRKSSCDVHVL